MQSLEKIYQMRGVLCEFDVDDKAQFSGEPGDLQELLVVEKSRTGLEVHREGCWVRFVPLVGGIEDDSEA